MLKHHQQNKEIDFKEWIPENKNLDQYSIITTLKNMKDLPLEMYKTTF